MLYLRPRNRFEELANCYLVGGARITTAACPPSTSPAASPRT